MLSTTPPPLLFPPLQRKEHPKNAWTEINLIINEQRQEPSMQKMEASVTDKNCKAQKLPFFCCLFTRFLCFYNNTMKIINVKGGGGEREGAIAPQVPPPSHPLYPPLQRKEHSKNVGREINLISEMSKDKNC